MSLEVELDSLDSVPEALHEFFAEQEGGGYRLAGLVAEEEVAGLKSAFEKEKDRRRSLMERIESLPSDLEDRLAELEKLRQEKADHERKKAEEQGDYETLRAQLQDTLTKERDQWAAERQKYEADFDKILREDRVIQEIAKVKGASVRLLKPHLLAYTKTIQEDGNRKVIVVGDDGKRRLNAEGNDMTIAELLKEMGEDEEFAGAFPSSGTTGGGASGRQVAGGDKTIRSKADFKDLAEKTRYIDEYGVDEFNALPAT